MKVERRMVLLVISSLPMWSCGPESGTAGSDAVDPSSVEPQPEPAEPVTADRGANAGASTVDLLPVDKLEEEEGRWRRYRTHREDLDLSDAQREQLIALEAIGYMDGSQESALEAGVRSTVPGAVQPGLNLYTSGHRAEARLVDLSGELLHTWEADFWQIWPDYPIERDHRMTQFWRRVRLMPDGGLLVIYEGLGLVYLSADSTVRWAVPNRAHHDLDVAADGSILVLTREARMIPRVHPDEPILEDFLSILDPATGEELRRISILEAVEASDFSLLKEGSRNRSGDLYHTNTLSILGDASSSPVFSQGRVLLYLLGLGTIAVLDLEAEELVWASTGPETHRHDPQLLNNGRILIFNNFNETPESTVTEMNIHTGEVLWSYAGAEGEPLYSKTCGTVQRLENGNTLITESDNGRAVEVDPEGREVWEFVSPHRAGPEDAYIATLFELVRLSESELSWLSDEGGTTD